MTVTELEIRNDITEFKARIAIAKRKLNELGHRTDVTYSKHKQREAKRKQLLNEIEHVERMIAYAEDALNDQKMY